jgi:AcrR family transcriptional regulator
MKQEERADPRVLRSKATIIDACAELIAEEGFAGVSIEAVSARSGAAKTTIYRHWPSREALCIEAFGACSGPSDPLPDTGTLRDDLVEVLSGLAERLNDPAWTAPLTSLLDAAARDPEMAALHRVTSSEGRRTLTRVLERAVERGELEGPLDLDTATALLAGPLFFCGIIDRERVDPTLVAAAVDAALAALGAESARSAAS